MATSLDPLYSLISCLLDPDTRARAELAYPKPFLSRFCTGDSARALLEWVTEFPVSAVHVMRLYLAPLALPFLRQPSEDRPYCVLGLDHDDARTYRRLARLYRELVITGRRLAPRQRQKNIMHLRIVISPLSIECSSAPKPMPTV